MHADVDVPSPGDVLLYAAVTASCTLCAVNPIPHALFYGYYFNGNSPDSSTAACTVSLLDNLYEFPSRLPIYRFETLLHISSLNSTLIEQHGT
jgi:hypothetical protein